MVFTHKFQTICALLHKLYADSLVNINDYSIIKIRSRQKLQLNAKRIFFNETSLGKTLNEKSYLKYDSDISEKIQNISKEISIFTIKEIKLIKFTIWCGIQKKDIIC